VASACCLDFATCRRRRCRLTRHAIVLDDADRLGHALVADVAAENTSDQQPHFGLDLAAERAPRGLALGAIIGADGGGLCGSLSGAMLTDLAVTKFDDDALR
jgi:hypothetical protein